MVMEIN